MNLVDVPSPIRPATGEAPFGLNEVFFSRTDPGGFIEAGNEVFRRVADYDWTELIGAPHNIVRHPDMPSAVFWILWDRIQRGIPTGAYVKNRAKDGLYYWVFAAVLPIDGGYLSVRIKPTSPLLDRISQEYAELRAMELEQGVTPEASAVNLVGRLKALGHPDYETFSTQALSDELIARDHGLGIPGDPRLRALGQMIEQAGALQLETAALVDEFHAMRTIPHNMQVIASRLEPTGGPVSTLSKNYGNISREMSEWFAQNVVASGSNFATIHGTVSRSMFFEGAARIVEQCDAQLQKERHVLSDQVIDNERQILANESRRYRAMSLTGLEEVRTEAERIVRASEVMQRHVLSLSSTRVLCKIESGRATSAAEALSGIIGQLGEFQTRITTRLDKIEADSRQILAGAS